MPEDYAYREIFDNLFDGIYFVDTNRVIQYWNKAAEELTGYPAEMVLGSSCKDNILTHVDEQGNSLCSGMCPLAMTMADGKPRQAEVFLHHREGHRIPVVIRISALTDVNGEIIGGVELFSDISRFKSIEMKAKELEELAMVDNLTRLANRNGIEREFFLCFEEHKRLGTPFGILFMDIDHFKKFNDDYGHDVGDRVLKMVAETLLHNSRPFDVAGRWGGEEFICIMRNVTSEQLEGAGNRLRILVENSYIMSGEDELKVTVSGGATLVREGDTVETLLKRADTLLYRSKRAGRNRLTLG
jgi:diguanylate cyclase (GGDEF)-like protein/PAS domain S-box-containing protein